MSKPHVYSVVGAGGTGSILLDPLVRFLTTRHGAEPFIIAVLDGDHVEAKNLERQLFSAGDLQVNKATALAGQVANPNVLAVPSYIDDDNVTSRIKEGDHVLICADNYDVRRRIEDHALTLDNVTIINGGNESLDGSVQIFIRRDGKNMTPPLSYLHPEILEPSPHDPTALSCAEKAEIQGGEQTIIANLASAMNILNALRAVLDYDSGPGFELRWTEVMFDLVSGNARGSDLREVAGWTTYRNAQPPVLEASAA
jgi:molybdopterin/thiamine biosynthesis adenylyltransferase